MKRPILFVLLTYIFGILSAEFIKINWQYIIIVLIFLYKIKSTRYSIIVLIVLLIAIVNVNIRKENSIKLPNDFEVIEVQNFEFGNTYRIKNGLSSFLLNSKENLKIGHYYRMNGKITETYSRENFRMFSYKRYLKTKGIHFELTPLSISEIDREVSFKYKILDWIKSTFYSNLNKKSADLLTMMLLSEKIDSNLSKDIKELGFAHILAVSGLHINVIIIFLEIIAKFFKLNRRNTGIVIIVLLILYGWIISFPVSLLRALSMYLVQYLAIYTNRKYDKINSFAASLIIVLLVNPHLIYSQSLYLSFMAIVVIDHIKPRLESLKIIKNNEIGTFISMQLGLAPLLLYFYSTTNLMMLLSNFILVPIYSIYLILGFIFIPLSIYPLNIIIDQFYESIEIATLTLNRIFEYKISIYNFGILGISIYYALLFSFLNYRKIRNRYLRKWKLYKIHCLILISIVIFVFYPKTVIVNFIDVGQGDSILIRNFGVNTMIDTGGNPHNLESSAKELFEYLRRNGVTKIDNLFITHDDIDHFGNLKYIKDYLEIDNIFSNNNLGFKNVKDPSMEKIENLELLIDGKNAKSSNDSSLVIIYNIFGNTFLFTGDVEENEDLIKLEKEIDFLKVSHHGSKHSTRKLFLENNKIKNAIISVGKNRYGHPSREVLSRLEEEGAEIYRTDILGNVEIRINSFGTFIKSYNQKYEIWDIVRYFLFVN